MSAKFFYEIATGRVADTNGRTLKSSILTADGVTWEPDPGSRFLDGPAETIKIYSDDPEDYATGDGVRLLLVFGLDNDFNFQSEFVATHATDGTIPVFTTLTYKRLAGVVSMQAGLVSNIGLITVEMSGGLWLGEILPEEGRTRLDTYTVPANHTASITLVRYHLEKLAGKDGEVHIQGRIRGGAFPTNAAWNHTFSGFLSTVACPAVSAENPIPFQFSPKTDLLIDYQSTDKDLRIHTDLIVIEELIQGANP
jgi:hypothetical protein